MFCWSANSGSLTITFSLSLFYTMLDCKKNKTNSFSSRVYKTKDEYAKINFFVYSKRDEPRWITVHAHDFLNNNKFTLKIIYVKDSSSKWEVWLKPFKLINGHLISVCPIQMSLTDHESWSMTTFEFVRLKSLCNYLMMLISG